MRTSITIDNLDGKILERLRCEAERRGVDLSVVLTELIERALGPVPNGSEGLPHHDLDALAGTWSDEEANAFLAAVADLQSVDEGG